MDLGGTDLPRPQDWYVLGRIAELLDDPAAARQRYASMQSEPPAGSLDKAACRLLAQGRIRILDPSARVAQPVRAVSQAPPPRLPEPSEQECRTYYQRHLDRFTTHGAFDCRCILLRPPDPGADPAGARPPVEERVARIMTELKAGRSFADLARTWSEDSGSRERGGLYQDIPPGRFVKAFEDAVFSQPLGQVGKPVQTPFGTFLILVEKVDRGRVRPYDEVKEEVRLQAQQARASGTGEP
jgi:hypothetical protein